MAPPGSSRQLRDSRRCRLLRSACAWQQFLCSTSPVMMLGCIEKRFCFNFELRTPLNTVKLSLATNVSAALFLISLYRHNSIISRFGAVSEAHRKFLWIFYLGCIAFDSLQTVFRYGVRARRAHIRNVRCFSCVRALTRFVLRNHDTAQTLSTLLRGGFRAPSFYQSHRHHHEQAL